MPAEPFEILRIDVDGQAAVFVPVESLAEAQAEAPARAWRVRPAGIALATALAAVAFLRLGLTSDGVLAASVLAVLGVLSVIDLESRVLPNRILGPAAAGVFLLQAALFPDRIVESVVFALAASLLLFLPTLFNRGAMGMGDVKLAGLLGLALGGKVLLALTVGSLASVPVALIALARGSSLRTATLPFGPFLAFGASLALLG
jgi:prepilin signal peptidase PulO-like enzyme (type II secretory pathway)